MSFARPFEAFVYLFMYLFNIDLNCIYNLIFFIHIPFTIYIFYTYFITILQNIPLSLSLSCLPLPFFSHLYFIKAKVIPIDIQIPLLRIAYNQSHSRQMWVFSAQKRGCGGRGKKKKSKRLIFTWSYPIAYVIWVTSVWHTWTRY